MTAHAHDMQPVPRGPQVPDGAMSLQGTFADAVLAAKEHLDRAAETRSKMMGVDRNRTMTPNRYSDYRDSITIDVQVGEAYARLAQALQQGAPGDRF